MKILITIFFTTFTTTLWADMIYLNDGSVIKGKIIQVNAKNIEYNPDGDMPFNIIPRNTALKIIYDDGTLVNLSKVSRPQKKIKLTPVGTGGHDEIHLYNGSVIRCRVLKVTGVHVEYDPEGDRIYDIFPVNRVFKVVYANGSVLVLSDRNYKENKIKAADKNPYNKVVDFFTGKKTKGVHTHDGLFFRFMLGFGYGRSEFKDWPDTSGFYPNMSKRGDMVYTSNSAVNLRIQAGVAICENLILFGEAGGFFMDSPRWNQFGETGKIGETTEFSIDIFGAGAGLSYYIMPYNVYLSGSVLSIKNEIIVGDSEPLTSESGIGYTASIGKEWWVSENWGLGFAILGSYSRTEMVLANEKFENRNYFIGMVLSTTYN